MELWACEKNFVRAYIEHRENLCEKDIEAISQFMMPEPEQGSRILTIEGNVATIEIYGPLSQRGPDRFDLLFGYGGVGYFEITEAIQLVEDDGDIEIVRFRMNTPGGQISGLDEVAQHIQALRKKKKVEAVNVGMMASAGYWLASQAEKIYSTSPANRTGSIGVILVGYDYTDMEKKHGVKKVRIFSKNAENKYAGFDKKGIQIIQTELDAIERIFLNRISEGRNIPVNDIIDNFGKGALLIAQDTDAEQPDAISVRMIDGLIAPDSVVKSQAEKSGDNINPAFADNTEKEVSYMDLETIMNENPAIKAQVELKVQAAKEAGIEQGRAEKDRVIKKAAIAFDPAHSYPAAIQTLATKVLNGEEEPAALTGAITMFDAQKEENAAKAAREEQNSQEETPPNSDNTLASADGMIDNEAQFQAELNRMKGGA